MKPRLYLETTIVSYLVARPSRDLVLAADQQVTREWWESQRHRYDIHLSEIVLNEAGCGDATMARQRLDLLKPFPVLAAEPEVGDLADALIHGGPLPPRAADDATHIAYSAVHGVHFLLTWNCRHIANPAMARRIAQICRAHGFEVPVICTPAILLQK